MNRLNEILHELGISKVKLAKVLGVSRQMIYNYLELEDINKTLKYNDSQWNEICKFCKQEQSLPLYMAFIKAKGGKIGKSLCDDDKVEVASEILSKAI